MLWLTSGVSDLAGRADLDRRRARVAAEAEAEAAKLPAGCRVDVHVHLANEVGAVVVRQWFRWDDSAPVWLVPGPDGQPGWATWDDDGNGIVDDDSELGTAWSDDHCWPIGAADVPSGSRVISRGGFVPLDGLGLTTGSIDFSGPIPAATRFLAIVELPSD